MFDFRYHVASLLAVFIALVIGILVGIGLSGRGFVSDAERKNLEARISDLRGQRDSAQSAVDLANQRQAVADAYLADTYPTLVANRLKGIRVAVAFVGSIDQTVDRSVVQAVRDAGGRIVRVRAFKVPLDVKGVEDVLANRPGLQAYAGKDRIRDLGRGIAGELVGGGKTPLLDALGDSLLDERDGSGQPPVDAIVLSRPVPPQQGATEQFLAGLYDGANSSGVPAVGVERAGVTSSAVPAFTKSGLSTVDSIDTTPGRLALVLELAGAAPGHYGVSPTAKDGILPPFPALTGG